MDTSNGYLTVAAISPSPSVNKINYNSPMDTNNNNTQNNLSTPKKSFFDAIILKEIRKQLRSPGGCDIHSIQIDSSSQIKTENLNLIKDRYLLSVMTQPTTTITTTATIHNDTSANTNSFSSKKSSYSHLTDLSSSNLKCLDIFTEENFLCKIVNEPIEKVKMAYFRLMETGYKSEIFGHNLIRNIRDIIPLNKNRTYIVIPMDNGYENLHTYIRDKRRLSETEARNIFHQICQTVQVCHRNGIILRDLKLKRFYFVDKERTKIEYESLEGSIILENFNDDTVYEKIGCPLYTAPELLCPNSTYQGKSADMWALGVILYTMLVGQYPFNEKNGQNLLMNIRNTNVMIPTVLSSKVRCLIRSLLRKIPEERLLADDIFYHPWLLEQPYGCFWPAAVAVKEESRDEHCVPDFDDDIEMG